MDLAVVVKTCSAAAREHRLHQRRRQLRRLAAPLRRAAGPAAPRPHAAGADLGRDGLRPAGGGGGGLLQPQRWVVNLAGDGDFLMNGQELATATGYGAKRC
jgi:thiamine pyrophosphate-dependent acetolactate synthase large subunit-like protein